MLLLGLSLGYPVLGTLFIVTIFYLKKRHRHSVQKYSAELRQLSQALKEADQHQDTLTHQLQQRDQKVENLNATLQDLYQENGNQKAELTFLKGIQEDARKQRIEMEKLLAENAYIKASLEKEQAQMGEKIKLIKQTEEHLHNQFQRLSAEALEKNAKQFLSMAESSMRTSMEKNNTYVRSSLEQKEQAIQNIVQPIAKALSLVDGKIHAMEKERVGAYETLRTQVHHLIDTQKELRFETSNLVKALRAPQVRGKWGEMQLKRVVEIAGMTEHCDFVEQASVETENGRVRPDMVIYMPGGHTIIVDAKAPLFAYLEALDLTDDQARKAKLQDHARHVRQHIKMLSQRAYTDQFEKTPDFVVLFLPGEMFFSAALEQDPDLLELGFKNKVILATPTTLIALLRAVAYGWRQESLTENAKVIGKLAGELSKRVGDMVEHMLRLGKNIGNVVDSYNQTVGTFERRVLVSARKFKEYDEQHTTIKDIPTVPHAVRALQPYKPEEQVHKDAPPSSAPRAPESHAYPSSVFESDLDAAQAHFSSENDSHQNATKLFAKHQAFEDADTSPPFESSVDVSNVPQDLSLDLGLESSNNEELHNDWRALLEDTDQHSLKDPISDTEAA